MKIYTYKNSTQLKNTKYWNEIKELPHFCASEVLTIGIKKFYGRKGFISLSTIDKLIDNIFPEWTASFNDIARYEDISKIINSLDEKKIDNNIKSTFKKNKRNVLEAAKFIIELEDDKYLQYSKAESNDVLNIFKSDIMGKIINRENGIPYKDHWIPEWMDSNYVKCNIEQAIHDCNVEEIRDLIKKVYNENTSFNNEKTLLKFFDSLFDDLGRFNPDEDFMNKVRFNKEKLLCVLGYTEDELKIIREKAIKYESLDNKKSIVFHGLYRLCPIHIRLFKELEKAGYEVILLNCYNDDFKTTYSCWTDLYKKLIEVFKIPKSNIIIDNTDGVNHRKIGAIFGTLIEGRKNDDYLRISKEDGLTSLDVNRDHIKEIFKNDSKISYEEFISNKDKYKDTIEEIEQNLVENSKLLLKFNSTMQFVQYVSQIFDETVGEDGKHKIGAMKEQFYGAKGTSMNNIFQVFYPDEFGVKPFLSYPIGQFILALYNMWDEKSNKLILNNTDLIECFNLDMWNNFSPNMIYERAKGYIGLDKESKGLTVDELKNRIEILIDKIEIFHNSNNGQYLKIRDKLNNLSYFNTDPCEYKKLIEIIDTINNIAKKIFINTNKQTSRQHYLKMIQIIKDEKGWTSLTGEEKKLINEIDNKLWKIANDEELTDIDTVRGTLNYYLSNNIGENINWLVRDLDQIEGDILSEAARIRKDSVYPKCYHYCMLSNENMIDDEFKELPWPLTITSLSENSKAEVEVFNVINRNIIKYNRCLLFQGMYYLMEHPCIKLKLSYIEYESDKKYSPYYLINELINVIDYSEHKKSYNDNVIQENISTSIIDELWNSEEKQLISCCPYKFMLSCGLRCKPAQYVDEFQVKFYFGRMIQLWIAMYWDKINEKNKGKSLERRFEYLKEFCLGDKLINNILPYLGKYMVVSEIKKLIEDNFNYMINNNKFYENGSIAEKQLDNFDELLNMCWKKNVEKYELYRLNSGKSIPIKFRIQDYNEFKADGYINDYLMGLNNGFYLNKNNSIELEYKISEHICNYCSFKSICLYSCRSNAKHLLRKDEGLIQK